jgi:hypothetical protein
MSSQRTLAVVFSFLFVFSLLVAQQKQDYQPEWDALMKNSPSMEGSLFYPLPTPCLLFSLEGTTSGEPMALMARGDDLSQQGGSETGCGIPEDATALMIHLRMESLADFPIKFKVWSSDRSEPPEALIESTVGQSDSTMVVVSLSPSDESNGSEFHVLSSDWMVLEGLVFGYFGRPTGGDIPGGGVSFSTESTGSIVNDFFGYEAGLNAIGDYNAFFGRAAGKGRTEGIANSGNYNAYFGSDSGTYNTSGSRNAFFGMGSGFSNSEGSDNSFFGYAAGIGNTTGNENAFFGRSAGKQNETGDENAFFGRAAGEGNVSGSKNAIFGYKAGMNAKDSYNSFFGYQSGYGSTTGTHNTGTYNSFFGYSSGYKNTTGYDNSFFGCFAGRGNTTGNQNSFFGCFAGDINDSGSANVFVGYEAGFNNTTGNENAYFGHSAGENATSSYNSFFGSRAGEGATSETDNTGEGNAFFGYEAGLKNTTGDYNAFFGLMAGNRNTTGYRNAFFGYKTGLKNSTGMRNSFFGNEAGYETTSGRYNAFFGNEAGYNNTTGKNNTFFGYQGGHENTTGNSNVFIGYLSGNSATVEDNNTMIGSHTDLAPGDDPETSPVENATAIGNRSYVSKSNSLVLGSIKDVNGATASVNVGIGTTAPDSPLHVVSTSQLARVIMAEHTGSEAPRNMMLLKNNGVTQFLLEDSSPDGDRWQFGNTDNGLNISLQGSGSQEFLIENDGDVWINNGTIMVTSYRASKENFQALNNREILERLANLPLSDWNYKKDSDTVRHIGPVSEDFYQTFGYGEDDQHIAPNDLAGVNTAAIQGLYQKSIEEGVKLREQLEERDQKIESLQSEMDHLRQELAEIKALVSK